MADDPGNSAPGDPLAGAKANLRDTVKWLATTLAALAAVVLAGTSLTGLAHLSGVDLRRALEWGAVAMAAVLLVIALLLRLLISEAFYFGDLFSPENSKVREELDRHAIELLPPAIHDLEALRAARQTAVERVRSSSYGSPAYEENVRYLEKLRETLARVTYFAQFEKMRQRLRRESIALILLTLIAAVGLSQFAIAVGSGGQTSDAHPAVTNIVYPPLAATTPLMLASPGETARSYAIRVLLTEAVRLNENARAASGRSSTGGLRPILDLIHGLSEAGLVSAGEADSLAKEVQSNAIGGGREILVHLAERGIDRLFPADTAPSATAPISITLSGCCASCTRRSNHRTTPRPGAPKTPKPKSAAPSRCPIPASARHAARSAPQRGVPNSPRPTISGGGSAGPG